MFSKLFGVKAKAPLSSSSNNHNVVTGTQGANIVKSRVDNLNINIGQPDPQIDITKTFAKYKNWVSEEKEHSLVWKKLKQLEINGKQYQIKRRLEGREGKFPEDELLNRVPRGVTSLVTSPAGSGNSTLTASTMINWAKLKKTRFDLVLYFSSLHEIDDLPLHKQLWGEYCSDIEEDTAKICKKLIDIKHKILVIIDGLGKKH